MEEFTADIHFVKNVDGWSYELKSSDLKRTRSKSFPTYQEAIDDAAKFLKLSIDSYEINQ